MIKEFVERFDAKRDELRAKFEAKRPESYGDIVKSVVELLQDPRGYRDFTPDPEKIKEIDFEPGYEGDILFIIGGGWGNYWYVNVAYGSCSVCDAFEDAYGDVDKLMTLALHILQGIKAMKDAP